MYVQCSLVRFVDKANIGKKWTKDHGALFRLHRKKQRGKCFTALDTGLNAKWVKICFHRVQKVRYLQYQNIITVRGRHFYGQAVSLNKGFGTEFGSVARGFAALITSNYLGKTLRWTRRCGTRPIMGSFRVSFSWASNLRSSSGVCFAGWLAE